MPATLRHIFRRRLLLLLGSFTLVMSTIVVLGDLHQTRLINRSIIANQLSHVVPRILDQQRRWDDEANHFFSILEWSGLLGLDERQLKQKLLAFFTAQSANMKFEGVEITDTASGKVIFYFWNSPEQPKFQNALKKNETLWYDERHAVLYTIAHKIVHVPGTSFNIYFFKAWDSAMLRRLTIPNASTFILLGDKPLLSSDGNLALESSQPVTGEYRVRNLNGINYQEDSVVLEELSIGNGTHLPLKLAIRTPLERVLPIWLVLAASTGITLLFGLLLFLVFGRWLGRLGTRLDRLADATLHFQTDQLSEVTPETSQLLQLADANKGDQISVVAQELSSLMTIATQRDAEQRTYMQTLDLLQDAVIEFTPDGRLLRATNAWKVLTGVDDFMAGGFTTCIYPEDLAEVLNQINALTHRQTSQANIRFRIRRSNDTKAHCWVEGRFAAVIQNEHVESIRGVVRDITSTYLQERQISHMALHDALTNLPNRVLLEDRMGMAITRAARSGQCVALGFIDLDHFKQVNDNFGHKIGDRMLKEVTQRLAATLRGTDTLSRWGGDEFVVLCPDLSGLDDAREITEKLSLLAREYITIDGTDFPFTFSAGFAVYPDDASNGEMLLAQADRAMFYAKAQGRNNIQFFNAISGKETGRQSFYIQSRLMQAIQSNEIQCWLQPIISAKTGMVIGAEALARWHEPEQGWIPPAVFIPMAESLGLIEKVGQQVWQQALQALTLFPNHHRLSVNLSKRQLFSNTIVQQFVDDAARANITPSRIMLEITEGIALTDVAYARERIVELDAKGFGISIDDFGVGYSSLSQLHEIPADELKLDISFVKRIHEQPGLSVATAILSIARSLNLECVAEGVEDARTSDLLRTLGVEMLQGYHFAKPMPITDYLAWLDARPGERGNP